MSENLKPCPWCGTSDHLHGVRIGSQFGGYTPFAIRCTHLDCDDVRGPTGNGISEASDLWNRRHQEQDPSSTFERWVNK